MAEVDLLPAVRTGVLATLVVCGGFIAVTLLGETFTGGQRAAMLALAAATAAVAFLMGLFAPSVSGHPRATGWLLATWSVADLALICALLAITGGSHSPFVWLLVLPVVYFATLLDGRSAVLLLGVTVATPAIGDGLSRTTDPALERVVLLLTVLAATALLTNYLSRELRRGIHDARAAQRQAERRARLLDVTGAATRGLLALDTRTVMDQLLGATTSLGFCTGWVALTDGPTGGLHVVAHVGLGDDLDEDVPPGVGISHTAATTGSTVIVTDYPERPEAHPAVVAAGVRTAAAVPVPLDGQTVGVLSVGTQRVGSLRGGEREALETLAVQAGLALRTARSFEREVAARRAREQEAERRHDYLATAAHELRTPLTVVHGAGTLLHQRWDDLPDDLRRTLAERVALHSQALVDLVERLHRLDELHHGTQHVVPRPIAITDLVAVVVDTAEYRGRRHLVTHHVPPNIRALADAKLLAHALRELLGNVLVHTPAGTHVHINVTAADGRVEVVIADDGPGIPSDELATITEAFERGGAVDTRPTRGVGIGLTLVTQILALHDSRLELTSSPTGTITRFRLAAAGGSHDVPSGVIRLDELTTGRSAHRRSSTHAREN